MGQVGHLPFRPLRFGVVKLSKTSANSFPLPATVPLKISTGRSSFTAKDACQRSKLRVNFHSDDDGNGGLIQSIEPLPRQLRRPAQLLCFAQPFPQLRSACSTSAGDAGPRFEGARGRPGNGPGPVPRSEGPQSSKQEVCRGIRRWIWVRGGLRWRRLRYLPIFQHPEVLCALRPPELLTLQSRTLWSVLWIWRGLRARLWKKALLRRRLRLQPRSRIRPRWLRRWIQHLQAQVRRPILQSLRYARRWIQA